MLPTLWCWVFLFPVQCRSLSRCIMHFLSWKLGNFWKIVANTSFSNSWITPDCRWVLHSDAAWELYFWTFEGAVLSRFQMTANHKYIFKIPHWNGQIIWDAHYTTMCLFGSAVDEWRNRKILGRQSWIIFIETFCVDSGSPCRTALAAQPTNSADSVLSGAIITLLLSKPLLY